MHAKRNYYRNAFNRYSTNMKKTWQTISETLNHRKGNRDFPQEFKLANGDTISEPKQIANAFNDFFFISIGDVGVLNANTKTKINICHVRLFIYLYSTYRARYSQLNVLECANKQL